MSGRHIFATLLLCASSAATAQSTSDLTIAYAKAEGSGTSLYLTNDTGSRSLKLYATPSKTTIGSLDLNPVGGEVAFIERRSGTPWVIKLLSFDSAGPVGKARTLQGPCYPDTVDYHPNGTALIYSDVCASVMNVSSINTDGTARQILHESPSAGAWWFSSPRWLRDGLSHVYARATDGNGQQLCRNDCDASAGELLWSGSEVGRMDVGRTSNWVLFDRGTNYISKINADTGELISNIETGVNGHFSPDDTRILYRTPHLSSGDYLQILNANGSTTRITSKGTYSASDWRR